MALKLNERVILNHFSKLVISELPTFTIRLISQIVSEPSGMLYIYSEKDDIPFQEDMVLKIELLHLK